MLTGRGGELSQLSPYNTMAKKKLKNPLDGYESMSQGTILQNPLATAYVNPNYERGDNIALTCSITETTTGTGTLTGSLLYFISDNDAPAGYDRTFTRQNQGGLSITLVLDMGATFLLRQLFVDYYTTSDTSAQAILSTSQNGVTYTTIGSTTYTSGTRIDNLIGQYINARFVKFYLTVSQTNAGTTTLNLGKIRLII